MKIVKNSYPTPTLPQERDYLIRFFINFMEPLLEDHDRLDQFRVSLLERERADLVNLMLDATMPSDDDGEDLQLCQGIIDVLHGYAFTLQAAQRSFAERAQALTSRLSSVSSLWANRDDKPIGTLDPIEKHMLEQCETVAAGAFGARSSELKDLVERGDRLHEAVFSQTDAPGFCDLIMRYEDAVKACSEKAKAIEWVFNAVAQPLIERMRDKAERHTKTVANTQEFLHWFGQFIHKASQPESGRLIDLLPEKSRNELDCLAGQIAGQATSPEDLKRQAKHFLYLLQAQVRYFAQNSFNKLEQEWRHTPADSRGKELAANKEFLKSLSAPDRMLLEKTLPALEEKYQEAYFECYGRCSRIVLHRPCAEQTPEKWGYFNYSLDHLTAMSLLESEHLDVQTIDKFFSGSLLDDYVSIARDLPIGQSGEKVFKEHMDRLGKTFEAFEKRQRKAGLEPYTDPATQTTRYRQENRSKYDRHRDELFDCPSPVNPASGLAMMPGTWMDTGGNSFGNNNNGF